MLYLENNLTTRAFTPERVLLLEMLPSQPVISVENASLLSKERAARSAAEEALGLRDQFLSIARFSWPARRTPRWL